MDRIFDFPLLYRIKVSLVKAFVRPVSAILIRNRISEEDVILRNVPDGARVYEIDCGDGDGFRLLRHAHRDVQYTGSDYNDQMVQYCKTRYPEATWEHYHGGPYLHRDGEFDYCVIRHVLHHIPRCDDIILTVREALRIANTVVLIEPLQSEPAFLRMLKGVYWRVTDGGVNYMRLDELHAIWETAGAHVTWEVWTKPLRQTYACTMTRTPLKGTGTR